MFHTIWKFFKTKNNLIHDKNNRKQQYVFDIFLE